jgi:hypothetical protein
LHPTNGEKELTPFVDVGKAERRWGEGWSCRRTNSLNLSGPPRSLKHWNTKQAVYASLYKTPNTHRVEDCNVYIHSEMMYLTLNRLEGPGNKRSSGVCVWGGGGWGHPGGDRGWGGDKGCGTVGGWMELNKIWSVKKWIN